METELGCQWRPVSVDGTTCDVSVPSSVGGPASRLDASKTYGMSVFAKIGPHEIEGARRDALDTGVSPPPRVGAIKK
jgi:hypothetical protein